MKNLYVRFINILLAFAVTGILISCGVAKPLYIEIPEDSKHELPENIQSVLLVARMVDDSYSDLKTDSLQKIFYEQEFNYDTIVNDLQSVDTLLKAMGNLLFESGRYDYVIPENRFLDFTKTAFLTPEMSWDEVKSLCKIYNTDAILSLDHFKTRVITTYDKEDYFVPSQNSFYSMSSANMKVAFDAVMRIYDPSVETVRRRLIVRDTLIWEDEGYTVNELFGRFTPVKKALSETGIAVALKFADDISPVWRQEKRSYFPGGDSNMKKAAVLAKSGQWDSAILLWKDTAEKTNSKSLKSKAEFNIALGYEMSGEIDKAITWALRSYETMFRTNTYYYLETLKRRKDEIQNK